MPTWRVVYRREVYDNVRIDNPQKLPGWGNPQLMVLYIIGAAHEYPRYNLETARLFSVPSMRELDVYLRLDPSDDLLNTTGQLCDRKFAITVKMPG